MDFYPSKVILECMGLGNHEYGLLTQLMPSPEHHPILGLPTRIIQGFRNAIGTLLPESLEKVVNAIV